MAQKSRWSFGKKHRASTMAECAPPNIVQSPAWLKNLGGASVRSTELPPRLNVLCRTLGSLQLDSKIVAEDAGVGTIPELEPDISGGGMGASVRSTELRPRLNVLC
jgi:hypothetical protein